MSVSRREFLKFCGASAALLGVGAKFGEPILGAGPRAAPVGPKTDYGVLIDTTRCVGCKSCQIACKKANDLPADDQAAALSPTTLSFVDFKNVSTDPNKPSIIPVKRQCMHCLEPACVSVCPVGALYKTDRGCVAYDADKCIGCRYCMTACPFGIPRYDWNSANPKINKCTQSCMANGKSESPACVLACPSQALQYGSRSELLTIAQARIQQNPGKYVNHIYGENELGGTSMLYLSRVPFERLGFRTDLPNEPLPDHTWAAMSQVPFVLGGAAVLLSGLAWWTHHGEARLARAPVPHSSPTE